jgi:hypothetical protein
MLRAAVQLLVLLLVGLAAGLVDSEPAGDSGVLVGAWQGRWVLNSKRKPLSAYYRLTVTKVEGERVYGRVEAEPAGADGPPRIETHFVGEVRANVLTFGKNKPTQLRIDGERMSGTRATQGRWPIEIELMKVR